MNTTDRSDQGSNARAGLRGILAPARLLDRGLFLVLLVLLVTCAIRYLDRHGHGLNGTLILVGAAVLATAYPMRALRHQNPWWPTIWVSIMVLAWAGLTAAAPSFAWCGVAVLFAVLQVLPYYAAVITAGAMTLLVVAATWRITHSPDPTLIAGPVAIAVTTLLAFRALDRESRARQELLDRLVDAQDELADEQHRSGALAERTRLSREIHDSVGQGLSSINLLLQAAEQAWDRQPAQARGHVASAAATARDGLDEVRRVVRDLAPVEPAEPEGLARELQAAAAALPGLQAAVRIEGDPVTVRPEVATALVRTVRGALANVAEHADASRVLVTLTFHDDEVMVDIRDDGRGFVPREVSAQRSLRGRGLAGIHERARILGGEASVESVPGEGTTVSVRFPLQEVRP